MCPRWLACPVEWLDSLLELGERAIEDIAEIESAQGPLTHKAPGHSGHTSHRLAGHEPEFADTSEAHAGEVDRQRLIATKLAEAGRILGGVAVLFTQFCFACRAGSMAAGTFLHPAGIQDDVVFTAAGLQLIL